MTFWPRTKEFGAHPSLAITQWFEGTGEFWGVGGGFLFDRDGRVTLATGYFFKQWRGFITRNAHLALALGGSLPIHVRLGVNGLSDTWWPRGPFEFPEDGRQSVEPSFEFQATLTSVKPKAIDAACVAAFNALGGVYGQEPFSLEEIMEMARR